MARHLSERKKLTVFDFRYYRYLFLILYIKLKARLKRG
jgi:hypothetical protein